MNIRSKRRVLLGLAALLTVFALWWLTVDECVSTWIFQGAKMPRCPDGRMRQTVTLSAQGLGREATGTVVVSATAHGVTSQGVALQAPVRRLEPTLFLVDAEGKETPLPLQNAWQRDASAFSWSAPVKLPVLPDGDYRLRARVTSRLGTDTVDAPLALYAPARIQVLTDRPLYEPGNQVRFRAVVLRAKDLTPLDGRPGSWSVTDPSGETVLEQRVPAGPWGVVSGDLPLDRGAPTGTWTARWTSGDASGETSFQVKPFTLPRFQVEARSTRPFWRAGESPLVEGRVVYGSGAPVANAAVKADWRASGRWPPPSTWLDANVREGSLPREVRTDAAGRFRLSLPRVPFDLRGQATLSASLSATDSAGEQVRGAALVLLAEDALSVSAVTELADGLVDGYSNRVYLRATTAAGRVLAGAELTVRRAWDPNDEGVRAVTDEDGVAAFQLDPGPPVNVVLPALPARPEPRPPALGLAQMRDLLGEGNAATLEDLTTVEAGLASLAPCARFVSSDAGEASAELGLRVTAGGAVVDVLEEESPLAHCLATRLRALALRPGRERLLALALRVRDPGLPSLSFEESGVSGTSEGLQEALQRAALDARECLPPGLPHDAPLPSTLLWRTRAGKREVEAVWTSPRPEEDALPTALLACIQSRFAGMRLSEDPEPAMGTVRLTAEPESTGAEEAKAQDQTMLGYELKVSAKEGAEELGTTTWVVPPARLPPTRLRASPVLARAGEEVRVELLRGPDFADGLPETLVLQAGDRKLTAKVERTGPVPVARFTLPPGFEGWAETSWSGALARVYVAPHARLALEVAPDKEAYAPGDLAHLQVSTWVDGKKGPAAVGLFGVDESLSQLVTLPGEDALDALRPAPTLSSPAFGVLDGTALAMGRIRGAHAAAATLLRVTDVPQREDGERTQGLLARTAFEPEVELTEPFYRVLAELTERVRAWEQSAPKGETLSPAGLAKQWEQALAACEQRGEKVTDAFGRRLRLSRLPPDLLALTDPRVVVVNGTRLPQDIENWGAWVARESP